MFENANITVKHLKNQFNKCPRLSCCQSFQKLFVEAFFY